MKRLLLLRHAKSSWTDPDLPDHDRPLNTRGKRDAPRVGQLIRDEGLVPGLILSSTARRARKTAAKVARNCGYQGAVELNEELYHADVATACEVLQGLSYNYDSVLLVGHNPGLQELLYALTGRDEPLPTAALALITLDIQDWWQISPSLTGELVNVWRPRDQDDA